MVELNSDLIENIDNKLVIGILKIISKGYKAKNELETIFDIPSIQLTNILLGLKRKKFIKMFKWYGKKEMFYGITIKGTILLNS